MGAQTLWTTVSGHVDPPIKLDELEGIIDARDAHSWLTAGGHHCTVGVQTLCKPKQQIIDGKNSNFNP